MNMRIIDFHTHFFPEHIQNLIYDWFDNSGWGIYRRYKLEEAIKKLQEVGYQRWVVAVYAHKKGIADFLNKWVSEISIQYPEIIPAGTIHQEDNTSEVVKKAFEYGVKGIKFHTHISLAPPEDERLFPVYEEIIRRNNFLILHGSIHPTDAGFIRDFDPYEVSGAYHVSKLLEKFPELTVIVAHMGMGEYEEFGKLIEKYPGLYLDTTMTHCMEFVQIKHPETPPPPDDVFLEKFSNRILLGSDFPFIPYPVEKQIQCIEERNISSETKEKIFHKNAETLLKKMGIG